MSALQQHVLPSLVLLLLPLLFTSPVSSLLTVQCAEPFRTMYSNSSASVAETLRGYGCPGGWTVYYSAGVYVGPRHCGVEWPSDADITLYAQGGRVEINCAGTSLMWAYQYDSGGQRLFTLTADPDSGWLFAQAASFLRITGTTGLTVRISNVQFQCVLYPGPAAIALLSVNSSTTGTVLDVRNCSFDYGDAFGIAVMGPANVSTHATSFNSLSRGALFCAAPQAQPLLAHAELDSNESVSCRYCTLSIAGHDMPCVMPSSTLPPLPDQYYSICHAQRPPSPPTPRPPAPPPTVPPAQSRLLMLVLISSFVIGAGLVALVVAAIWRRRATSAALASMSTDTDSPAPQDFL